MGFFSSLFYWIRMANPHPPYNLIRDFFHRDLTNIPPPVNLAYYWNKISRGEGASVGYLEPSFSSRRRRASSEPLGQPPSTQTRGEIADGSISPRSPSPDTHEMGSPPPRDLSRRTDSAPPPLRRGVRTRRYREQQGAIATTALSDRHVGGRRQPSSQRDRRQATGSRQDALASPSLRVSAPITSAATAQPVSVSTVSTGAGTVPVTAVPITVTTTAVSPTNRVSHRPVTRSVTRKNQQEENLRRIGTMTRSAYRKWLQSGMR